MTHARPPKAGESAREADDGRRGAFIGKQTKAREPRWRRIARLEFLSGFVEAGRSWAPWFIVAGAAPGLAVWRLTHLGDPAFVLEDKRHHLIEIQLNFEQRVAIIKFALVSLAVMGVLYGVLGWFERRRHSGLPLGDYYKRLNTAVIPVMLLPVATALLTEKFEVDLQILTLALSLVVGVAMATWHYQTAGGPWRQLFARGLERLDRKRLPDFVMVMLVLGYGFYFGWLSVLDHHNLGTHVYDLGLYDNTFWNTVNGDTMACSYLRGGTHISAHFDPIIILLSPIYRLYPRAESLLWLQSFWLAMGGVPLYLHAKRTLQSGWQANVVVSLFLLAPALHGINMFDFHSLALMVPLVMWAVYLIDVPRLWAYWFVIGLLLLTREDMPFVCWFIALYALLSGRRWTGVLTLLVATAWLVFVKYETNALLAGDKGGYSYSYYYEEMIPEGDEGVPGLLISTFADPIAAVAVLLKPAKLLYWGKVFLPLLFIPVFAKGKRVMYLYGLAFIGLVSRKYVFSVHFQYSSVLLPFLLMGFPDGLRWITSKRWWPAIGVDAGRLGRALLMGALTTTMLVSAKFGAIVPNAEFRAGWNRLQHKQSKKAAREYQLVWELIDRIPREASVCSNSSIGPQISNRAEAYKWPACHSADYVLMPNKGLKKADQRKVDRLRRRRDYDVDAENDEFVLFRRLEKDERAVARKSGRRRSGRRNDETADESSKGHEDDLGGQVDNPYRAAGDSEDDDSRAGDRPRSKSGDDDEE